MEFHRPGAIEMKTTYALLSAVRTPIGHLFLAIGVDTGGLRYLSLVSSLTSVIRVPRASVVPCDISGLTDDAILNFAAAHLVGRAIMDSLFRGQKVLIHNPSGVLAAAISTHAYETGVDVIFTTDVEDAASVPTSWIRVPRYVGRSDISRLIPEDIACFVGLSYCYSENERTIESVLSPYCRKENTKTIFSQRAVGSSHQSSAVLRQLIETAVANVQIQQNNHIVNSITIESLVSGQVPEDPLSIVDWTAKTSVPVRVTRFDAKPLFKTDRTYWICGLSGALGISLCDWMIDRGLKYLVLTSRNPRIEPAWVDDHARNGVTIKIISW